VVTANAAPHRRGPTLPVLPAAGSGRGGYYQDDGPGDTPPEGLYDTPDAEPKIEPYTKSAANKPYVVFGKTYTPLADERPFKQRGVGSWYGKKFHGQRTSSGELYDMYKMTAAHPTLPIPCYARVTNLNTGAQVIVRVNDRGPFHSSRIADLSYTAALKLGFLGKGSHEIEIERLLPDEIARINQQRGNNPKSAPATTLALAASPVVQPRTEPIRNAPTTAADQPAVEALPVSTPSTVLLSEPVLPVAAPLATTLTTIPLTTVTTPATPPAGPKNGYYLQLGAYSQANNAESVRAKLVQNLTTASLPAIEVVQAGTLYRLYSGPFDTRAEAANAAQRVQNDGVDKPLVIQR
jgi:rare lipoprotein A